MRRPELDRPDARLAHLRTRVLLQARYHAGALDGACKPLERTRQTHSYYRTLRQLSRMRRLGRRCQSKALTATAADLRRVVREAYRHSDARRACLQSIIVVMAQQDDDRTRNLLDRLEGLGRRLRAPGMVAAVMAWREDLNETLGAPGGGAKPFQNDGSPHFEAATPTCHSRTSDYQHHVHCSVGVPADRAVPVEPGGNASGRPDRSGAC